MKESGTIIHTLAGIRTITLYNLKAKRKNEGQRGIHLAWKCRSKRIADSGQLAKILWAPLITHYQLSINSITFPSIFGTRSDLVNILGSRTHHRHLVDNLGNKGRGHYSRYNLVTAVPIKAKAQDPDLAR